jgi:hypothetical protein
MSDYRRRRSGQGDPNAKRIDLGPIAIWFSYTTPIAFRVEGEDRVVRQNDWSNTTGRHLNEIDGGDKKSRVSGEEFMRRLQDRVGRFFFPRDLVPDCPAYIVADWLRDRGMSRAADAVQEHEMAVA